MSPPWFFHEAPPAPGERALLAGDEARHAAGSRRLGEGDRLVLFDGRGTVAETVFAASRRGEVEVEGLERRLHPPPVRRVVLASALPKGDRLSTMLNMATQLGVGAFRPLDCERGVVRPREVHEQRWRRIAIEACKQSRRPWLPAIDPPARPADLLASLPTIEAEALFAHPGGVPLREVRVPDHVLLLVGPEGGFTDEEVHAAAAAGDDATLVSLGDSILRIETAAVALVSWATFA